MQNIPWGFYIFHHYNKCLDQCINFGISYCHHQLYTNIKIQIGTKVGHDHLFLLQNTVMSIASEWRRTGLGHTCLSALSTRGSTPNSCLLLGYTCLSKLCTCIVTFLDALLCLTLCRFSIVTGDTQSPARSLSDHCFLGFSIHFCLPCLSYIFVSQHFLSL